MRKTSILLAAAVAALGSTVGMAHDAPTRFVRDGVAYEYTTEMHGDRQVIQGHRVGSSEPFRLVVRNGRVRGTSGGMPVAFDLAETKSDTLRIASR